MTETSIETGGDGARRDERARLVEGIVTRQVEAMGMAIVRVIVGAGRSARLQIMVERLDGTNVTVDDCVAVSRAVSAVLDVEEPIRGPYTLEVSSPGIERPLTRLADYERFSGQAAQVEMDQPIDGQRRFRGRLAGLVSGRVRLDLGDRELELPFDQIRRAKLIAGDEKGAGGTPRRGPRPKGK